jgi:hypothetical protein
VQIFLKLAFRLSKLLQRLLSFCSLLLQTLLFSPLPHVDPLCIEATGLDIETGGNEDCTNVASEVEFLEM